MRTATLSLAVAAILVLAHTTGAHAASFSIDVKPARITAKTTETQSLTIENHGAHDVWITITSASDRGTAPLVTPSRFTLPPVHTRTVPVLFHAPVSEGELRIQATRRTATGTDTGLGIIVPYSSKESAQPRRMLAAAHTAIDLPAHTTPLALGALLLLTALISIYRYNKRA